MLVNHLKYQLTVSKFVDIRYQEQFLFISDWVNAKFYALDELGSQLFISILTGDVEAKIEEISNTYNVELETVKRDTKLLLEKLKTGRVIVEKGKTTSRGFMTNPLFIRLLLISARISFRLLGLLPTIRLWRCFHHPIKVEPSASEQEEIIEVVSQTIQEECSKTFPFAADCKERALVGYSLLRSMGFAAKMILAAQYYPFSMHAWSESGGKVIGDQELHCSQWTPIKSFD